MPNSPYHAAPVVYPMFNVDETTQFESYIGEHGTIMGQRLANGTVCLRVHDEVTPGGLIPVFCQRSGGQPPPPPPGS